MEEIRLLPPSKFPALLRELPDPPRELHIRGILPDEKKYKFLTVVGSRKYSSYGRDICEKLLAGLRGYPIAVVSGLALGIDSIAHRAALAAGLPSVAVPGSGLSEKVLYPAQHLSLARDIVKRGGALLSEFKPDFRATPWSFLQRNRIMAGLSHATLVIEAEKKSGTLVTAKLATDYNRDVLTVPGSAFSPSAEGPHLLLRLGATPIRESREILEALHFETDTEKDQEAEIADCTPEERALLALLTEPRAREEIISALKQSASEVNMLLSLLEIKGLIRENLGKIRRA